MARFRALRISVGSADDHGGETKPIQISVRGSELARVNALAEQVLAVVRQVRGATDVDTSEEQPRAEVRVSVDSNAAGDLGLDLSTVAATVRGLVAGEVVSKFEDADSDSYDVRLRVDPSERVRTADLLSLDLPGRVVGVFVSLHQVARAEPGSAPSNIRRRDLVREVRVSASTEGRSQGEVVGEIRAGIASLLCLQVIASALPASTRT
jgi:HAE1 family hydrophobic/amphiphilic exporter-1